MPDRNDEYQICCPYCSNIMIIAVTDDPGLGVFHKIDPVPDDLRVFPTRKTQPEPKEPTP